MQLTACLRYKRGSSWIRQLRLPTIMALLWKAILVLMVLDGEYHRASGDVISCPARDALEDGVCPEGMEITCYVVCITRMRVLPNDWFSLVQWPKKCLCSSVSLYVNQACDNRDIASTAWHWWVMTSIYYVGRYSCACLDQRPSRRSHYLH